MNAYIWCCKILCLIVVSFLPFTWNSYLLNWNLLSFYKCLKIISFYSYLFTALIFRWYFLLGFSTSCFSRYFFWNNIFSGTMIYLIFPKLCKISLETRFLIDWFSFLDFLISCYLMAWRIILWRFGSTARTPSCVFSIILPSIS